MYLKDLDTAMLLMSQLPELFGRLETKSQHTLLEILINQIIVDQDGRIVDYMLNKPFSYLNKLDNDPTINWNGISGSKRVLNRVLSAAIVE